MRWGPAIRVKDRNRSLVLDQDANEVAVVVLGRPVKWCSIEYPRVEFVYFSSCQYRPFRERSVAILRGPLEGGDLADILQTKFVKAWGEEELQSAAG